ncbi:hypothetical protein BCR44DRAFT_54826 [Catenaria anguillulae PL171]|uniref:EF-hand domain-containing protein n=1 Tax=Catenaria anguillulae PL171 TaxID=765915 RepID=A0A1Y2I1I7_9FUNG|nr:hypothetical protein BCR44DRAFT_54826 [Catenaria anguillulae PL171]
MISATLPHSASSSAAHLASLHDFDDHHSPTPTSKTGNGYKHHPVQVEGSLSVSAPGSRRSSLGVPTPQPVPVGRALSQASFAGFSGSAHSFASSLSNNALFSSTSGLATGQKHTRGAIVDVLTADFLKFSPETDAGAAVERRAYLVDGTLPVVVLALERLLHEMERRKIQVGPDGQVQSLSESQVKQPPSMACTSQTIQRDHLPAPFEPLLWLAQYLYRHNPKHSAGPLAAGPTSMASLTYKQNLRNISNALNNRLDELQKARIAQLRAERAARDKESQRRKLIKQLIRDEKTKTTRELTAAVFRRLGKINRGREAINLRYLLSIIQNIRQSPNVVVNSSLSASIDSLDKELVDACISQEAQSAKVTEKESRKLLDQVSAILATWTPQDFSAFLQELTQWMDGEQERVEEQDVSDLIGMLRRGRDGQGGATQGGVGMSVDDFIGAIRKSKQAGSKSSTGDGASEGGKGSEDAELDQLEQELKQMDLGSVSDDVIGKALRKATKVATVTTVGDLMAMLREPPPMFANDPLLNSKGRTPDDSFRSNGSGAGDASGGSASASDAASSAAAAATQQDDAEDIALLRKHKLKMLFDTLDQDKLGVLVTRELNSLISATATFFADDPIRPRNDLNLITLSLKFAIPVLQLMSHTVQREYFVDYACRKLMSLNDADFTLLVKTLGEQAKQRRVVSAEVVEGALADQSLSESKLRRQLDDASRVVYFDYQTLCSQLMQPIVEILQARHEAMAKHLRVDIAMFDQLFTVLASSNADRRGDTLRGEVFNTLIQKAGDVQCIAIESMDGSVDELNEASRQKAEADMHHESLIVGGSGSGAADENHTSSPTGGAGAEVSTTTSTKQMPATATAPIEFRVGHVLAVPAKTLMGEVLGCVHFACIQPMALSKSLATTREIDMFTPDDVELAHRLADALARAVATLERISKTVTIAESSASFLREQAGASTKFYVVEGNDIYFANDRPDISLSQEQLERMSQHPCRYMRPLKHQLVRVDRDSDTDFIFSAAENRSTSIRGQATAVPVLDNDVVVAVMVVTSLAHSTTGAVGLQDEDMEEVAKVAEVLGTALSNVRKQKPRQVELEAEELDDDGELIFAKFMLDSLRDSISKLDNAAIAELKSYKKPPPTIHKVLKCLCFLFGKTPKQVKQWSDTLKFINMDLLKQMVAYDPTGIQKKGKFVRIRRVLKTIPHGDVKKRGSVPAQTVYAWLIVSLDLRDKAVMARRRAALAGGSQAEVEETDNEMDEDTDVDD